MTLVHYILLTKPISIETPVAKILASILISTYRHFVFQVVSIFILAALTYPSYRIYKHTIIYASGDY
ncbi:hypothetical protein Xsto_03105 [Xenorhabdus stockiae]|uniref:Uncharacterized protein n=1 Tax=Xenorhabdus stockiae TaxID=351614 RepID=A0A2D0KLT9_9GAMM|nr:hypothetical protein Xsto_03105 [Xenorhabdus stockiae]